MNSSINVHVIFHRSTNYGMGQIQFKLALNNLNLCSAGMAQILLCSQQASSSASIGISSGEPAQVVDLALQYQSLFLFP